MNERERLARHARRLHEAAGTLRAQAVVAAMLLAAVLLGGVLPAASARHDLAEHREQARSLAAAIVEAGETRRQLTERVIDLRARARAVDRTPPTADQLNARISALLTTAEASGLAVDGVNVATPDTRGGDTFADIGIDAAARAGELAHFLRAVARDHPFIAVGRIDINAGRSGRDRTAQAAEVRLTLVWRGRETPLRSIRLLEDRP